MADPGVRLGRLSAASMAAFLHAAGREPQREHIGELISLQAYNNVQLCVCCCAGVHTLVPARRRRSLRHQSSRAHTCPSTGARPYDTSGQFRFEEQKNR